MTTVAVAGRAPSLAVRAARVVTLVSVVGPPLVLGAAAWQRRWMAEDGFIFLRVVRQIRAGHGPVYNAGERVEAFTSALWTALLTLLDVIIPARLEVIALGAGITLSVAGLTLAVAGARRLWDAGPDQMLVPLGALVIIVLPPFWEFSTSGLESGLTFAWLGSAGWLLARAATSPPGARRWWPAAVLVGAAPLVRPDLALVAAPILAALIALRATSWRQAARLVGAALAAPVAYQLFRMGYYAALVPNPALAKEATESWWSQGWRYLSDFAGPYRLPLPLLAIVAAVGGRLVVGGEDGTFRCRRKRLALAMLAPLAGGVLHGLYIVRVGGDFMHARLLLPSLFAFCLPVMVIGVRRGRELLPAVAGMAWALALVTVAVPQLPYEAIGPEGITDERGTWVAWSGQEHPVQTEDFRGHGLWRFGDEARRHFAAGGGGFGLHLSPTPGYQFFPARGPEGVIAANIGVLGMAAGSDVRVVDVLGLADPLGARLRRTARSQPPDGSARPGHDKALDLSWVVARFVAEGVPIPPNGPPAESVEEARRALRCPPLRRLLEATSAPLSPGRFLRNMFESVRLHGLRIDNDPAVARARLCGTAAAPRFPG